MSLLKRIFTRPQASIKTSRQLYDHLLLNSTCSDSGVPINESTALKQAAFYSGVRLISETIASLPLNIYERVDDGKNVAVNNLLQPLLHDSPNQNQTAFEFIEFMTRSLIINGNALAVKNEVGPLGNRKLMELIPVRWDRVEVLEDPQMNLFFKIRSKNGEGSAITLPQDKVFRLLGPSDNGVTGRSLLEDAVNALGISIAAEKYGAKVFANDARPSGILIHPGKINQQTADRIKESWDAAHAGLNNQQKTALLEEGMSYERVSMTTQDAQLLESRMFSVAEMARFLRVPLHMLYDDKAQPRANMEQAGQEFLSYTLRPWLVRWEQRIKKDLIIDKRFFAEFNVMGLLRGDVKTRFEVYATARTWGIMSVNDILKLENMNPIENGDIYLQPLNMSEAGTPPPQAPAEPAPEPVTEE